MLVVPLGSRGLRRVVSPSTRWLPEARDPKITARGSVPASRSRTLPQKVAMRTPSSPVLVGFPLGVSGSRCGRPRTGSQPRHRPARPALRLRLRPARPALGPAPPPGRHPAFLPARRAHPRLLRLGPAHPCSLRRQVVAAVDRVPERVRLQVVRELALSSRPWSGSIRPGRSRPGGRQPCDRAGCRRLRAPRAPGSGHRVGHHGPGGSGWRGDRSGRTYR
jgi:hypothetical protein